MKDNKLHWFETFKIDANINDEILEDINKIIKEYKQREAKTKKR